MGCLSTKTSMAKDYEGGAAVSTTRNLCHVSFDSFSFLTWKNW